MLCKNYKKIFLKFCEYIEKTPAHNTHTYVRIFYLFALFFTGMIISLSLPLSLLVANVSINYDDDDDLRQTE